MSRYRHDPSKSLVGFVLGEVLYALEISRVKEIINPLSLVLLPRASPFISGVADYRGDVVPVIDLRVRFGLPQTPPTRRTKWIVIDVGGRCVALVVDQVTEVFGTAGTELRPAPALGPGEDVRGIMGVTTRARKIIFVLDTAQFGAITEPLLASGALEGAQGASLPPRTA